MEYKPKLPDKNVNVTPTSPIRDFLFMIGGLTIILIMTYIVLGLAVDFIAPRVSPETEKKIAVFFSQLGTKGKFLPKKSMAVQKLAERLQEKCVDLPYPLTVRVIKKPQINALALPGGNIIVFSGLLKAVQDENELAFVLAHEMGHFVNRDHLRGIGRSLVFMTLSATLGSNNLLTNKLAKFLQISELAFSRKQESAADQYALDQLHCQYGHGQGAISFFTRAAAMAPESFSGHYFSSHPHYLARIEKLKQLAHEQGIPLQTKQTKIAPPPVSP